MNITQTNAFIQDVNHYTSIAKEWMYTTRKQEIKNSIYRLEKLRGKDYVNKLENRVTSLESRQDTLYKLLIAIPSIIAILGVLAIYLQSIHP